MVSFFPLKARNWIIQKSIFAGTFPEKQQKPFIKLNEIKYDLWRPHASFQKKLVWNVTWNQVKIHEKWMSVQFSSSVNEKYSTIIMYHMCYVPKQNQTKKFVSKQYICAAITNRIWTDKNKSVIKEVKQNKRERRKKELPKCKWRIK